MEKYVDCGEIKYKDKTFKIIFNKETFLREFLLLNDGTYDKVNEPYKTELDNLYNKKITKLDLRESIKIKLKALVLAAGITVSVSTNFVKAAEINDDQIKNEEVIDDVDMLAYLQGHNIFNKINYLNSYLTRAEACQILFNIGSNEKRTETSFNDLKDSTYEEAISWAVANNIMVGNDNNFMPNQAITKEQLITILYRYIKNTGKITISNYRTDFVDFKNFSKYAREAISWAVKNKLIDEQNGYVNCKEFMTKEDLTSILYNFIEKYDLLKIHDKYNEEAKKFLNELDSNKELSNNLKNIFSTYADVINQYHFDNKTLQTINNTFQNMKYETNRNPFNFGEGVQAGYFPQTNSIVSYIDSGTCETDLHEGFHGFSNNYSKNGLDGFGDLETSYGIGITEGNNQLLTEEYSGIRGNSYFYNTILSRFLVVALGNESLLTEYTSSNLVKLTEQIMEIYEKEYSKDESYDKAVELINRMDTIRLYEIEEVDFNENFLLETVSLLNQLIYLSRGYNIGSDPVLNAYYDELVNRDKYIYYDIDNYFINKDFINDDVKITTIRYDEVNENIELSDVLSVMDKDAGINYILDNYQQYVDIKTISNNQELSKTK